MSSKKLSDSFKPIRSKGVYKVRYEVEQSLPIDESQMNDMEDQGYEDQIKVLVAERLINEIQPRAEFESAFDDFREIFDSKTPTKTVEVRAVMEELSKLKERLRLK